MENPAQVPRVLAVRSSIRPTTRSLRITSTRAQRMSMPRCEPRDLPTPTGPLRPPWNAAKPCARWRIGCSCARKSTSRRKRRRPASRCVCPENSMCRAPSTMLRSSPVWLGTSRARRRPSGMASTRPSSVASRWESWAPLPHGTTHCRWPCGRSSPRSPRVTPSCSSLQR